MGATVDSTKSTIRLVRWLPERTDEPRRAFDVRGFAPAVQRQRCEPLLARTRPDSGGLHSGTTRPANSRGDPSDAPRSQDLLLQIRRTVKPFQAGRGVGRMVPRRLVGISPYIILFAIANVNGDRQALLATHVIIASLLIDGQGW